MDVKRATETNHSFPEGKSESTYPYALSDKVFHTKQLFLYSEKLPPGRKASAPHFHKSIDEIVFILKGELYAVEGENSTVLKEGDAACFYAKSGKKHYLENKTEAEVEFLIFRRSTVNEDVVY